MTSDKYEFLMDEMDSFQLDFLLALKELGGYKYRQKGVIIKCKIKERWTRKSTGSSKPYFEYWRQTMCTRNEYRKARILCQKGILKRISPSCSRRYTLGYKISIDVYEDFLNMLEERREIRVFNRLKPILEKGYKI